jgi:hypothetical protein
METFKRSFSSFGFCAQCQPQDGLSFFLADRVQSIQDGDLYSGFSALDPDMKITALWTRSGKSTGRTSFERMKRRFELPMHNCPCGAPAEQLHHVIPRFWFRLNRLPESGSHFAENLLPVCSDCNNRLYNSAVFAHDVQEYWRKHQKAHRIFQARLEDVIAIARASGVTLYPPPEINFEELPGQPVLAKPDKPTDPFLKVVAYIDVFWWIRVCSEDLGPRGMAWRSGNLRGQGNPYMVLVSWDHLSEQPQTEGRENCKLV